MAQLPTADDPPAIRWHDHFQDPSDDIVLVSNDGLHFRASSFRLMRSSSVFRDMLSSPETGDTVTRSCLSGAAPIHLDYNCLAVQGFLVLAHSFPSTLRSPFPSLPWISPRGTLDNEAAMQLLDLLECFDCSRHLKEYWDTLDDTAADAGRSFDLAVFASKRNDCAVGATALSGMYSTGLEQLCISVAYFETQLDRLEPTWATCVRGLALIEIDGVKLFRRYPRYRWLGSDEEIEKALERASRVDTKRKAKDEGAKGDDEAGRQKVVKVDKSGGK